MQTLVEIGFEQLVQLAKQLPTKQWTKLKAAVETQGQKDNNREAFLQLLLKGPTFSKKQLKTIEETRKAINEWRTK